MTASVPPRGPRAFTRGARLNAPIATSALLDPQLDFRVGKILRFGKTRTLVSADLYNSLNSSAVLTYNNAFVPNGTWLQPQTVLTGRLIKIAAELTF